jgi:hypothetical protein
MGNPIAVQGSLPIPVDERQDLMMVDRHGARCLCRVPPLDPGDSFTCWWPCRAADQSLRGGISSSGQNRLKTSTTTARTRE